MRTQENSEVIDKTSPRVTIFNKNCRESRINWRNGLVGLAGSVYEMFGSAVFGHLYIPSQGTQLLDYLPYTCTAPMMVIGGNIQIRNLPNRVESEPIVML